MEKHIKKITVRLNIEDYSSLIYQSDKFGKSQNEFIREIIRKNLCEDIKEYNLYLDEIRKQTRILSNNINQLAKLKNSKILIDELEKSKKLNEELVKLCQLLK